MKPKERVHGHIQLLRLARYSRTTRNHGPVAKQDYYPYAMPCQRFVGSTHRRGTALSDVDDNLYPRRKTSRRKLRNRHQIALQSRHDTVHIYQDKNFVQSTVLYKNVIAVPLNLAIACIPLCSTVPVALMESQPGWVAVSMLVSTRRSRI